MSTPGEIIREKAQKVLMLQSLINMLREQEEYGAMSDSVSQLAGLADEIRAYAVDHDLFEGLIIYTNATSFVFHVYESAGYYSLCLPYSLLAASEIALMLRTFEVKCPAEVDAGKAAHILLMSLSQVIFSYLGALRVKANEDSLYQQDFKEAFGEIVCYYQGAYEYVRQVDPQSRMIDIHKSLYAQTRALWHAEDRHRDLDYLGLSDACENLNQQLDKIKIQD